MISLESARALRAAGLRWQPVSGDAFSIDAFPDGPDGTNEFEGEVFTVSDMAIEPHRFDTGVILGFNGTTEWALDSVAIENALWLPREDQLRELLGSTFRSLVRDGDSYRVETSREGEKPETFTAAEPAAAYAAALLALIRLSEPDTTGPDRTGPDFTGPDFTGLDFTGPDLTLGS